MLRVYQVIGGVATLGLGYSYVIFKIEENYKQIFRRYNGNEVYYDRSGLKKEMEDKLNLPSPCGIVFVCGRVSNGKTSLVRHSLKDRKYIATLNWRSRPVINNEEQLVKELKQSFRIRQFLDYIPFVAQVKGVKDVFAEALPRFRGEDPNSDKLGDVLLQIEDILAFQYDRNKENDVTERPVIFIDEVDKLLKPDGSPPSPSTKRFVEWLIEMSKDKKYCDVVVSTTNAKARSIFTLADPRHVATVIVEDLTREDFAIVIREYWEHEQKRMPGKDKPWLGENGIESTIRDVGSTAGSVILLLACHSEISYLNTLHGLHKTEQDRYKELVDGAKNSCGLFGRFKRDAACYTMSEFKSLAKHILARPGPNPSMALEQLAEAAEVPQSLIWYLVHRKFLFVDGRDPSNKYPVMFNSKLFMDVYKESQDKEVKRLALLRKIDQFERASYKFPSDLAVAQGRIKDLNDELEALGK